MATLNNGRQIMKGVITKALSGFYYVNCEGKEYVCKARGSFRKNGISPLVGDNAEFETVSNGEGVINGITERRNSLSRPAVANIDKLFIVSAYDTPPPNTLIIDKLTVIARHNNIEPLIVFNKSDKGDFSHFERIYKNAGFKTFVISALNGEGFEALKEELKSGISAFTGNSGVGKSSILNCIFGEDIITTSGVSEKLGRGRHTTRHIEIYKLPTGGFVADTPGFSSLESENKDYSLKENLCNCFTDFGDFPAKCRFNTCSHTKEKGCAVIEAVRKGLIEETRYSSYLTMYDELKDLKEWNINPKK